MHCMHQKTDYACYARTQLRKRLHTMHTETRIGVSVGLRARKCMQLGMHTDCIQSAYKHIKRVKERFFLLLLLYIVCSPILYCLRFQAFISLLLAFSSIHGSHHASLPVLFLGRAAATLGGRSFERYMRIAYPHGKQTNHGRHHHRPPHPACGLRKYRGGGLH